MSMNPSASTSQNSVVGLFKDRYEVEKAIKCLKEDGFRSSDICVLWPSEKAQRELVHKRTSRAPEGFAVGASFGGLIGLVSFAVIWALEYNSGDFFDLMIYAFAGAGFCGLLGAIAGMSFGINVPRYEVERYEGFSRKNGLLLSAHVDDKTWSEKAISDFIKCGGKDIGVISEEKAVQRSTFPPDHRDELKGIAL